MMMPHEKGTFIGKLLVFQKPKAPIRDSESHPFEFAYFDTSKDKRDFLCRYPERDLQQLASAQCFKPNIVVCV